MSDRKSLHLLQMAVLLDSPRMKGEAENTDASAMSTTTAMAKIIRFYLRAGNFTLS